MTEIEIVQAYRATDGTLFENKADFLAYTARDLFAERAQAFIASRGWESGQATRAMNLIVEFLAFEVSQDDAYSEAA